MSQSVTVVPHDTNVANDVTFFDLLTRQVDYLAKSTILPSAYRGKPADIIAAGLAGRAFGWDVMTSMNNYHVIEGKATLRPEAMLGLVRRAGHSVVVKVEDGEQGRFASATGTRVDNNDTHTSIFSTVDAKAAGLITKRNWSQYLDAMLTWRAVSALCRVLFPDVVMGAGYVPEEMGAPTEVYDDPLADPVVSIADAKRALLSACGGDKVLARELWATWADDNPDASTILQSDLDGLMEKADVITVEFAEEVDSDVIETTTTRAKLGSAVNKGENNDNN